MREKTLLESIGGRLQHSRTEDHRQMQVSHSLQMPSERRRQALETKQQI